MYRVAQAPRENTIELFKVSVILKALQISVLSGPTCSGQKKERFNENHNLLIWLPQIFAHKILHKKFDTASKQIYTIDS